MALAALCDDSDWGRTWRDLLQHRFSSSGDLDQHAVGNLLIVALWELLGDTVEGLDWVGRLLGARGRVLPMASVPLRDRGRRGRRRRTASPARRRAERRRRDHRDDRRRCASTRPTRRRAPRRSRRSRPPTGSCSDRAPGTPPCSRTCSCPGLRDALGRTSARTIVTLNLASGESGETAGMRADQYLEVLHVHAPELPGRRRRRRPDGRRGRRRRSPRGAPTWGHVSCCARSAAVTARRGTTRCGSPARTRTCSTASSATSAPGRTTRVGDATGPGHVSRNGRMHAMALTAQVKDELARLKVDKTSSRKAEVSATLRFAGGLAHHLGSDRHRGGAGHGHRRPSAPAGDRGGLRARERDHRRLRRWSAPRQPVRRPRRQGRRVARAPDRAARQPRAARAWAAAAGRVRRASPRPRPRGAVRSSRTAR